MTDDNNQKKHCKTMITIAFIEASPDLLHEINVFIELYLGNYAAFTETARVIQGSLSFAALLT